VNVNFNSGLFCFWNPSANVCGSTQAPSAIRGIQQDFTKHQEIARRRHSMKTNGKHEIVARINRGVLIFAALLGMVLSAAGTSNGQTSATQPPISNVNPAGAEPGSESAPASSKPKSEGIKVHGHWTIEVRNPDGSLDKHVEFENSLIPSLGANLLENFMLGMYTPGAYTIQLLGNTSAQTPASAAPPCTASAGSTGACNIGENLANCFQDGVANFCSLTRMPAVGTLVNNQSGVQPITFQGTFTASQPGYVGVVTLLVSACVAAPFPPTALSPVSPSACSAGSTRTSVLAGITQKLLDTPVQVLTAQQSVSVSVQISFQ
jgi:hypothetical protein